jgi:hypothetical protein
MVGLAVVAALAVTGHLPGPSPCVAQDAAPCSRVLFIGNSYTYVNDLPTMFAALAGAGGHRVETGMAAEGGATLADQLNSSGTLDKLGSAKWDFVVLQEQSQIPASEQARVQQMYPAARLLVRRIEDAGARPIFFMTWAHRDGWPENGLPDYESMQVAIDDGYLGIARELGVPVAPVGYAWLLAHRQDPRLDLWQPDGIHPSMQGSYLAACVFYAAVFHESPEGLSYLADLPGQTARLLQTAAADAVLTRPEQWNLP